MASIVKSSTKLTWEEQINSVLVTFAQTTDDLIDEVEDWPSQQRQDMTFHKDW